MSSPPIALTPFEPLLNGLELSIALESIHGGQVCTRTLQRWCSKGMPYRPHPITRKRRYLFSEVYAWLAGACVVRDIRQESLDRSLKVHRRKVSAA